MNVSEGLNPPFLEIPEDCREFNGQFLGLGEMVKLTRMGETHQLKPGVFRQMEYVVVVEKNSQIPTLGEGLGVRVSWHR